MINKITTAYETLKANEAYWMFDNDYRTKYQYIKEVATTDVPHTRYSIEYIADIAEFMMEVNRRIFK